MGKKIQFDFSKNSEALDWRFVFVATLFFSCAGVKQFMAIEDTGFDNKPIDNPFGTLSSKSSEKEGRRALVVRSKKGENSVEFEIPTEQSDQSDWEIPRESLNFSEIPETKNQDWSKYSNKGISVADREIVSGLLLEKPENAAARKNIESELGLAEIEELGDSSSSSYLGRLDQIKQLYREARYEASLLEVEGMLQQYPMDPKLHEMRGTLLDRLGHPDLAQKSWGQALEIQPKNDGLRKYLEKKQGRLPAEVKLRPSGGTNR